MDDATLRKMRFSRTLQLVAVVGFVIATVARVVTTGFDVWVVVFGGLAIMSAATWYVTNRTIRRYARESHG